MLRDASKETKALSGSKSPKTSALAFAYVPKLAVSGTLGVTAREWMPTRV